MLKFIKRYIFSILVGIIIIYLSLFKPPKAPKLETFENFDKIVHMCMYLGFSGMIWFEYLKSKKGKVSPAQIFWGGFILPVIFGGLMELSQKYLTDNREGDWLDFAANSVGVLLASMIGIFILRPFFLRRNKLN